MIDDNYEKRNCYLGFEIQSLHVTEKRNKVACLKYIVHQSLFMPLTITQTGGNKLVICFQKQTKKEDQANLSKKKDLKLNISKAVPGHLILLSHQFGNYLKGF